MPDNFRRLSAPTIIVAGLLAASAPLALGAPRSHGPAPSAGLLKAGADGPAVVRLQRALGIVPATGHFGRLTKRAVRRFQRRHGLVVDGVVGPRTRAALGIGRRILAASAPSGTLARIAQCESGGNPRAISANGRYRGKYQFSRATWRNLGGKSDPARASESEQDRIAAKLLARSGTAPWPSCA